MSRQAVGLSQRTHASPVLSARTRRANDAPNIASPRPRAVETSGTSWQRINEIAQKARPCAATTPPNAMEPGRGVCPAALFTPTRDTVMPAPVSVMTPRSHSVADAKGVQRPAPAPSATSTSPSCSSRLASAVVSMIAMMATRYRM